MVISPPSRPDLDQRAERSLGSTRWAALEPYRAVLPASFVALWIGFASLPDSHPLLRAPLTLLLAILVGIGAELCARLPGRGSPGRMTTGTLWIIPAGATVVIMALLTGTAVRTSAGAPLLAAVVVGAIWLQGVETTALNPALSWTRPLNTGIAFALAFAVFTRVPGLDGVIAGTMYGLVAALTTMVVLRGCRASARQIATYVAITVALTAELGVMLHDARSPAVAAGVPLLGLYALSTTSQAVLDGAPRRAYVEVALVTGIALVFAVAIANRH